MLANWGKAAQRTHLHEWEVGRLAGFVAQQLCILVEKPAGSSTHSCQLQAEGSTCTYLQPRCTSCLNHMQCLLKPVAGASFPCESVLSHSLHSMHAWVSTPPMLKVKGPCHRHIPNQSDGCMRGHMTAPPSTDLMHLCQAHASPPLHTHLARFSNQLGCSVVLHCPVKKWDDIFWNLNACMYFCKWKKLHGGSMRAHGISWVASTPDPHGISWVPSTPDPPTRFQKGMKCLCGLHGKQGTASGPCGCPCIAHWTLKCIKAPNQASLRPLLCLT